MEEQYYKAVPVSESPKKEGWYRFIDEKGYTRDDQYYFQNGEWYSSVIENNFCPPTYKVDMKDEGYTHYLQPIQLPDAQVLREALEKILAIKNENIGTYLQKLIEIETIAREALSAGDGSPIIDIFKWLLGYTDFPQRQEGEGQYYWRTHLREKLKAIGIEIENSPSPPIK